MAKTHIEDLLDELAPHFADRVRRIGSGRYEVWHDGRWVKEPSRLLTITMQTARPMPPGPLKDALLGSYSPYGILRRLAASGFQGDDGIFRASRVS